MTLISSSVPLDTFYCHTNTLTQQNSTSSTANEQALSWLHFESATVPTPIKNNKYRTLASIQAQSLQQHLHLLNNSDNLSPVSPSSTKPSLLDTQSTPSITTTTTTTTTTTSITNESTTTHSITAALQAMDASHGTCFLTWIHNPTNLDYISLRLRPLCLEYPLVDVANVLRWIGADWSSTDCKALFRAVTSNWDQSKRRILAFLLIRDEEMRQKAKSKLVEFAQKSSTTTSRKSTQLRTPGASSSSISPQQQHQRIQPTIHYQQRIQQQQQQQRKQLQSVSVGASTASVPSIIDNNNNNNNNNASWRGGVNMTALENIAAASLITGIDMTLPLSTSSLLPSSSIAASGSAPAAACASTTSTNLYSRRFSPY
ncbi:hypothetical protein K457DRAFT_138311 [Linnemannia elongata AG-77]|uniref:Uncharacterized protein n=1 Tax=Linnemannia elongata AG-77 TaxID=1314771 RepID=A0A197JXP3_9FUNG|nr:hypothetical protein K457DRAFT_138311 [Linnemannia elongata AG-77]